MTKQSCLEKMEMAMRATEDIAVGEDVTPPLAPLSLALYDSFLPSRCASCFSSISSPPSPLADSSRSSLYCSARCSSSASSVFLSPAEELLLRSPSIAASGDTSDLRAALRLLAHGLDASSWRVAGLLTNREKLMSREENSGDGEVVHSIRNGARALAAARRRLGLGGGDGDVEGNAILEEAALCATITNAVEVQDVDGRGLGIAVYGTDFSWINHSCSANACYRFQFSGPEIGALAPDESRLRIVPHGDRAQMDRVACRPAEVGKDYADYGPKIIVRSIKAIKKGEEVTVAYTDLLQPKAARQFELQSKYRFKCSCIRCDAEPLGYVDYALQDFRAAYGHISEDSANCSIYQVEAARRLSELMDDVISEYLSDSDPKSCCEKLESLLTESALDEGFALRAGFKQKFHLQPLHHLSLNACITLASTYRIRSNQLVAPQIQAGAPILENLKLNRISGAYSLLLAGAVHHLFRSEPSLMASAATFWVTAGESLLSLSRNSVWSIFSEKPQTACSSAPKPQSCRCSLMRKVQVQPFWSQASYADFENISRDFMSCIAVLTKMLWGFLAHGSHYLQAVKNPVDFGWLKTIKIFSEYNFGAHLDATGLDSYCERDQNASTYNLHASCYQERRLLIFRLGVHCLMYGELLWSICYGRTPPILHMLSNENDVVDCSLNGLENF